MNNSNFSTTCLNNTSTNNFNNNNNSSNSTWIGDELPNNSKKRGIQKKAPRRQKTSKNIPLHSNHNIQSTSFKVLQSTENSMMGVFKKTRSMCSLASYESVWNMNNVIQNSSPSIIITSSPHCPQPQQQQQQFSTSNSTTQTITNTSRKKRIMSCSSLSSMCDSSSSENTIIASVSPLLNNITSSASQNQSLIIPHSQPSWNSCESQIVQLPPFSAIIRQKSTESLTHISPEQQSKKGRSQMLSLSELLN